MKNKIKTKLGYIKSMPRPTQKYLDEFYSNLYFKDGITSTYNNKYNKKERFFKEFRAEITINFLLENLKNPKRKINFLEIGSGQGFLMNAALKTNWKIKGVDYQSEPIKKINKKVLSFFIENDPSKFINDSIKNKDRFDIIVIQNVLEHVINPEKLISNLSKILNRNGILLLQVPIDYSPLQNLAMKEKKINKEYWYSPPQHLNYFNIQNLKKFLKKSNFNIIDAISDFPIEMYLWGNKKNYVNDKSLGSYAHQARVSMEHLISKNSSKDIINFYRSLYKIGFGRNQIVIVKQS